MSGGSVQVSVAGSADWWRCSACPTTNAPHHRMCNACKKWRDLDWACVMCGYKNFAKRDTCKECGAGHVPEFNKEQGNYDINQEVQGSGLQVSFNTSSSSFNNSLLEDPARQDPLLKPPAPPHIPDLTPYEPEPPFQSAPNASYQSLIEAPFKAAQTPAPSFPGPNPVVELPWMCGLCNFENTPKRILCFECSGHRERVEVRNRAAEIRLGGGRSNFGGYNAPPRDLHYREDPVHSRRFKETPPWLTMNQDREERPEDRSKDWACGSCSNRNFAKRKECNRCKKPREECEDKTVEYPADIVPSLKRGVEPYQRDYDKMQRRSLTPLSDGRGGGGGYEPPRQEDISNDWVCGKCNINCFAKKKWCFRCGGERSKVEDKGASVDMFRGHRPVKQKRILPPSRITAYQQNSWEQFKEREMNLSGHQLRLHGPGWEEPARGFSEERKPKKKWVDEDKSNDWNCKFCKINNFAKRPSCFSCKKKRGECEEVKEDQEDTKETENTDSQEKSE